MYKSAITTYYYCYYDNKMNRNITAINSHHKFKTGRVTYGPWWSLLWSFVYHIVLWYSGIWGYQLMYRIGTEPTAHRSCIIFSSSAGSLWWASISSISKCDCVSRQTAKCLSFTPEHKSYSLEVAPTIAQWSDKQSNERMQRNRQMSDIKRQKHL